MAVDLLSRYELTHARADLDEWVELSREAVTSAPVDLPERAAWLCQLGAALYARFMLSGAQADLAEAIDIYRSGADTATAAPSVRIRAARAAGSSPHHPGRSSRLSYWSRRSGYCPRWHPGNWNAAISSTRWAVCPDWPLTRPQWS